MSKILIITDNLKTQINGVVTTFTNLEQFAKRDGYSFNYITPDDFPNISTPGYPEVKLSWCWSISKKIKQIDPDYIHIATEGPVGLAGRLACNRHGYMYNTSYHTKFPEFLKKLYGIPVGLTYSFLRWFHKDSRYILVPTDSVRLELMNKKFKQDIYVWSRGVDRSVLKPTTWTRKINDPKVILYVGRVSKEKNLDVFKDFEDRYEIWIVGDGPYRKELESKLHAKFFGYQHGQKLADLFFNADVFVFPSLVDTFGIVLIESMSVGTPVAAYPVTGPIDIVEEGINGYTNWDLSRAIEMALSLDRSMVIESSSKWTWEQCWNIFRRYLQPK